MEGPPPNDRRQDPVPYADRYLKDFRVFDGDDVAESVIGGAARLQMPLPGNVQPRPRLVAPGEPALVEAARAFFADPAGGPVVLEVGSGLGRFINGLAAARPGSRLLGCETRLGFCMKALARADRQGTPGLYMAWGDARVTIPMVIPPASADEAYLLYPDPWWKRRHARRRHGAHMATVLADALRPGGRMILKSDVAEYLQQMVDAFLSTGRYDPTPVHDAPPDLPLTDRETRLVRDGISTFTSVLRRL